MAYLLILLGGFAAGVVMNSLFEKSAVEEVQKLRAYLAGELEKIAARL